MGGGGRSSEMNAPARIWRSGCGLVVSGVVFGGKTGGRGWCRVLLGGALPGFPGFWEDVGSGGMLAEKRERGGERGRSDAVGRQCCWLKELRGPRPGGPCRSPSGKDVRLLFLLLGKESGGGGAGGGPIGHGLPLKRGAPPWLKATVGFLRRGARWDTCWGPHAIPRVPYGRASVFPGSTTSGML